MSDVSRPISRRFLVLFWVMHFGLSASEEKADIPECTVRCGSPNSMRGSVLFRPSAVIVGAELPCVGNGVPCKAFLVSARSSEEHG
jgi:hypothetical protein